MFNAFWSCVCAFFNTLFGRTPKAKVEVKQHVRHLKQARPPQFAPNALEEAVSMGTQALGALERGVLARIYSHKSLTSGKTDTVILVLDLSSSIEGITREYAAGYLKFIDSLIAWNPNLILLGFDRKIRLLYQGPIAQAPRYTEKHFAYESKESLLGNGTGLYRAVLTCSLLATELSRKMNVSVNWLTDGLDSAEHEIQPITLSMAAAMCHVLQRLDISYRVIGMLNPVYSSSTVTLDEVLARLNPPPVRGASREANLQTLSPDRAFALAQSISQKRIAPESLTEIDLG